MNRYETAIPRIACGIAAVGMTAITIGMFGVMPARMGSESFEPGSLATSKVTAPAPMRVVVQCGSSNSDRKPEG